MSGLFLHYWLVFVFCRGHLHILNSWDNIFFLRFDTLLSFLNFRRSDLSSFCWVVCWEKSIYAGQEKVDSLIFREINCKGLTWDDFMDSIFQSLNTHFVSFLNLSFGIIRKRTLTQVNLGLHLHSSSHIFRRCCEISKIDILWESIVLFKLGQ